MKVLSASFLPSLIGSINTTGLRDKVWLVGGAVRDSFLDREVSDFDFAVDGDAVDLALHRFTRAEEHAIIVEGVQNIRSAAEVEAVEGTEPSETNG